jgi:hypothetical protein
MIGDDITVAVLGVKGNEVRGFWCICGRSKFHWLCTTVVHQKTLFPIV